MRSFCEEVMGRSFMRGAVLAVVAGLGLVGSAWAQNRDGAWEVRPFGGYVRFGSEAGLKDSPSFGFSFGYHWTKRNEIEFMYSGTSTHDKATGAFSADLITAQASYIRNFFLQHRDKVVAFVEAGTGVVDYSTFGFTLNPDLVGDEQDWMVSFGGGFRFFGSKKSGLRVDAREVRYTSRAGVSQKFVEFTAGLTLVFGGV